MRYSSTIYARAFAEAIHGAEGAREKDKLIKNFVALVVKNGDAKLFSKITDSAARMLREKEGIAKISFETARPLSPALKKRLHALAGKGDETEEKIVPALVAGIRIVRNDEEQFDMTLAHRLQKLFT